MDPARWNRIEDLLQAALDLPLEQRAGFLTNACGSDERLRAEVAELLAEGSRGAALSDSPVAALREPALPAGRTISHYRIEARIGAGGMGEVYRARDDTLQRTVAVKALPAEMTGDEDRVRRFEQEALAASRLNHPNIVTIYEVLHDTGAHYIVAEHIEGRTLRELLTGPLPVEQALTIAIQIAAALKAAHTAWIIHRDIKPENIMVRADGLVKLVDFGIAKLHEEPSTPQSADAVRAAAPYLTVPGAVLGTARYMSPEQARGDPLDGRTDLYSLGLVLYEMLTGDRAGKLSQLKDLQRIVRKLLRQDRNERYSTAGELLGDLERERSRLASRTARRLLGLSALIVSILIACIAVTALLSVNEMWEERVLRDGHTAAARQAVLSPDGRLLVTCGEDGQVIVWDFVRRRRVATLAHRADTVAYSPDGRWFATGGADGTIIIWSAQQRTPIRRLRDDGRAVTALNVAPDGARLVSASDRNTALWETRDWKKVGSFPNGVGYGNFVFSPLRRQFASSQHGTLRDIDSGAALPVDTPAAGNGLAMSPDSAHLVAIGAHGHVSFYRLAEKGDLRSAKLIARRRSHQDHGRSIAYSPDGRLVASAAEDILLWDAATQRKIARFDTAAIVWNVFFSADGHSLISTHGDGAVMVWNVAERERVANLSEHAGAVRAVAFSPDGSRIASAGEDRAVTLWDLRGQKDAVLAAHTTRVTALAFSRDGRDLASVDQEGVLVLWDTAARRPRLTIHRPEPIPSYTVAISPGGGEVATSGSLYATADGRVVNDYYPAHSWRYQQTYGIAFTSDGKHLVSVTTGGWVLLADRGGRVIRSRQLADSRLITVSISSDGKWLATGEDQGAVRLWSVEPLREVAILGRHAARVKSVAFSPDGKSVASAGDDKMIALWDVQRRRLRARIGTHASPIYSVAFSPDGQRLVSGEHDHSVRLYTRRRTLWGVDLR